VISDDDLRERWQSFPRRIYLDTSTLHTIYDYGEVIFEEEAYAPQDQGATNYEDHEDQILALQRVLMVNQRAQFEFVITEANLRDSRRLVRRRGRGRHVTAP
jgi:hypothetical protein